MSYKFKPVSVNERTTFPHNALWSSPRSGNHWIRFIVEYLTSHPTCGANTNRTNKDMPIFTNRFPSTSHPLAHVSGKLPYILYKAHKPYPLLNDSTIILLVRDINELMARRGKEGGWNPYARKGFPSGYIKLIKAYDEFSGTKMLIYYEDLLLNPEREILRIKHFLGISDSRYKTFMNHYDYYAHLSKNPLGRGWGNFDSGLNFNFHRERVREKEYSLVKEYTQYFHQLLADPEYQQVKPYIARYM